MKCLIKVLRVGVMYRITNMDMRKRYGNKTSLLERMDRGILRWFCHMERIGDWGLTKRIYRGDVDGVGRRGKSRRRWKNGVGAEKLKFRGVREAGKGQKLLKNNYESLRVAETLMECDSV